MSPRRHDPPTSEAIVDLRMLKGEVARLYPAGHPLREVLLREPDFEAREEGLAKLELLIRLVFASKPRGRP